MIRKKTLVILFAILLLGAFLRLYKLDKFPPSLFGDELDVGYQAYSILKTGRDYYGQRFPISFHSISDWRTPLLLYSTVPFVAIFGLNEWGVRLPPAIFGILTIPAFFLLARKLFKNDNLGLVAAFWLSISIWHLQYSRAAFEVTQMLLLLLLGVYFFLKGLEKWQYLILSAIFLTLTPYSYNTAKFFLPVIVATLFFIFREQILQIGFRKLVIVLAFFVILGLPMAYDILHGQGGQRFSILSIFTDPVTVPEIGFARQTDAYVGAGGVLTVGMKPSISSRFFHNKFLSWGLTLMKNYFEVFSTNFLFLRGDINYRHSVQGGFGHLYWSDGLFLILGMLFLFQSLKDKKLKTFLFLWFILSPIPSILTRDGGGHATRLILLLPPLLIFISYGLFGVVQRLRRNWSKRLFIGGFGLLFLLEFVLYLHRYYIHYPLDSEEWWHCGFKETAEYIKENGSNYKYVLISERGEPPLIFSLFWLGIDPRIFQEKQITDTQIENGLKVTRLGETNFYLGRIEKDNLNPSPAMSPDLLYIVTEGEFARDFPFNRNSVDILETIYYPNGRINKYILVGKHDFQ